VLRRLGAVVGFRPAGEIFPALRPIVNAFRFNRVSGFPPAHPPLTRRWHHSGMELERIDHIVFGIGALGSAVLSWLF
jgi:hypothetical protein